MDDRLIQRDGMFMRTSDRSRFERVVEALVSERQSAVLLSDSDAMLDHYGRMLTDRLRGESGLSVEVYFPNSTEAVLARFNRILADMKVAEAISPNNTTAPARVLVVYDGKSTGLKEVQLLARLLKDFPGANSRVVLLLQSNAVDTPQKVEALGKRALRWDVERPSAEEARLLMQEASEKGMSPEAQSLLDTIGVQGLEAAMALKAGLRALALADEALGLPPDPPSNPESRTGQSSSAPAKPLADAPSRFAESLAAAATAQSREEPVLPTEAQAAANAIRDEAHALAAEVEETPKRRKFPALLLVGLVALGASAAITAWQQLPPGLIQEAKATAQDLIDRLLEDELDKSLGDQEVAGPPPVAADPVEAAPADGVPASEATESTAQSPAVAPTAAPTEASVLAEAGVTVIEPKPKTPAAAPSAKPLGPVPEQLTSLEIKQQGGLDEAASRPLPKEKVEDAPAAKPQARPAKLPQMRRVDPGFYVQHISRDNPADVEAFWKANPALGKARLLRLRRIGAPGNNYVLLSGPFQSLDEAKTFMASNGLPKDMWVRQASALRKLLP